MKPILLSLFTILLITNSLFANTPYSTEDKEMLAKQEKNFNIKLNLINGRITYSITYVSLLYKSNLAENIDKANNVLNAVISYQEKDSSNNYYGQWPWEAGQGMWDQNVALFMAPCFFIDLWEYKDIMNIQTKQNFMDACNRIFIATNRRWDFEVFDIQRDYKSYTNVFIQYIESLLLYSTRLNNTYALIMAEAQWSRWFNYVSYNGIDEFASRGYFDVDFSSLIHILKFAPNDKMQNQVKMILDYMCTLEYGITHPLLKVGITGNSRDYRTYVNSGDLRLQIINNDKFEGYDKPKEVLNEYNNRNYPYTFEGRATETPYFFKTWMEKNYAMASMTGGHYYHQQVHSIVAVGNNENERAMAYFPGSFAVFNGYTAQNENKTLCLFARTPTKYHTTQWTTERTEDISVSYGGFGLGITKQWKELENSTDGLVLEAYNHKLIAYPFVIENNRIKYIQLERKHRDKTSECNYHKRDADFDEYVFPNDAVWFGCYITVVKNNEQVKRPKLKVNEIGNVVSLNSSDKLNINIKKMPTGELIQLYPINFKVFPLIKNPATTIWPGEFVKVK